MSAPTIGSQGELAHLRAVHGADIGPFTVTWRTLGTLVPIDITGSTFTAEVFASKVEPAIATLDVTIIDAPNGVFSFGMTAADSLLLPSGKQLTYSIDITMTDGIRRPLLYGNLHIRPYP